MRFLHVLILLIAGLGWNAAAWSATIWRPSDQNTNYVALSVPESGTVSFALFDVDEITLGVSLAARLPFDSGDQISFIKEGGIIFAVNDSDPMHPMLMLGNSYHFAIGANDGSGWVLDDGAPTQMGTNLYALKFIFPGGSSILLQADAKVAGSVASVVPAPGAVWLLGSGLLALIGGCARRRDAGLCAGDSHPPGGRRLLRA